MNKPAKEIRGFAFACKRHRSPRAENLALFDRFSRPGINFFEKAAGGKVEKEDKKHGQYRKRHSLDQGRPVVVTLLLVPKGTIDVSDTYSYPRSVPS